MKKILLVTTMLITIGCATVPQETKSNSTGRQKGYIQNPQLELKEYQDIKKLYTTGAFEAAHIKAVSFEKRFPGSEYLAQVYNIHGLSQLLVKKPKNAVPLFEKSLELDGNSETSAYVHFNLATALHESGASGPALQTLLKIDIDKVNQDTQIKAYFLKSKIYQELGNSYEAASSAITASRITKTAHSPRPGVDQQVQKTIDSIQSLDSLERLYEIHKSDPGSDRILLRLGKNHVAAGNNEEAQSSLKTIIDENPSSPSAKSARTIINSNVEFNQGDPIAIGVLLPQTGKLANAASAIQHAIELAFDIYSNPSESPSPYSLFFEDSGATPEQAIKGLENLYSKHKVLAVIGPVSSKGIEQVTTHANDLGIPLFPLSQFEGQLGDWTVQANITLKNECEEIARNAVEKLGFKKIAIIYPKHRIAEKAMQFFWDKVEQLGGEITGVEAYSPEDKDYSQVIDKLTGRFYTDSRSSELDALAEERIKLKIKKRTRRTQQYFDLQPIIDFDAVFIPDDAGSIHSILPFFKYRDVTKMTYLGFSAWNSPELFKGTENTAEGSYLVDGFNPESTDPSIKKFMTQYQEMFSEVPSSLDAAAFDIAKILTSIVKSTPSISRSNLMEQMRILKNYKGVTGLISQVNGTLNRPLKLLKVQNGKISETR